MFNPHFERQVNQLSISIVNGVIEGRTTEKDNIWSVMSQNMLVILLKSCQILFIRLTIEGLCYRELIGKTIGNYPDGN